jgi:hypothetical protein
MIPAVLIHSSDWFISENLMVADDNFKSLNSTDIMLGDDVFFEVCRHGQKARPRNYPILWGREIEQRLKKFQGKVSSFAIMTT